MRALLIPVDGDGPVQEIDLPDGEAEAAEELHRLVGGHLESIAFGSRWDVAPFICETGKLDNLPLNTRATVVLGVFPHDVIAGPCVLTGVDAKGATVALPDDIQVEKV